MDLQESKVLVPPRERMDDVSAQMIVEVILRSEGHQNAQIVSKLVAVMSYKVTKHPINTGWYCTGVSHGINSL